jgi:hypothetical protein
VQEMGAGGHQQALGEVAVGTHAIFAVFNGGVVAQQDVCRLKTRLLTMYKPKK